MGGTAYTNNIVFLKKFQTMQLFLTAVLCTGALAAAAQPKTVTQATITTKTTIVALDGEQAADPIPQPSGDGGPVIVRRRLDDAGETVSKTLLKDHLVKTQVDNAMGRTTTIRDNKAKITTTLMEIMGNKRGFYATDEEQAEMAKRMDSLTRAGNAPQAAPNMPPVIQVFYRNESKTIAGYNCQKAVVHINKATGELDSSVVWYNTDIKLEGLTATGGAGAGFMSFRRNSSADVLERIKGFPMQYEMKLGRNRLMTVEVTKLDIEKEVKDKEFEISKDFDVKPAKDMQGPGGGMQIRIGGPGGGLQ
jgi:hypothetical protein